VVTVLATSRQAPWHPWPVYRDAVLPLLGEVAVVEAGGWDGTVPGSTLVSLADEWERPLSGQAAAGIESYVASGGNLLVLHNGISIQERPELARLVGARFTHHPDAGPLEFQITPRGRELWGDVSAWTMDDEPYRFEFLTDVEILLEYRHEDMVWPAGWRRAYGRGRVTFLMPGHYAASYLHPTYASLIRAVLGWS